MDYRPNQYVSVTEVAKAKGIHPATIRRACERHSKGRSGGIPATRVGRAWIILWRDAEEWSRSPRGKPPRGAKPNGRGVHPYIRVSAPGHPNASANGTIFEHRLVMANLLGRPLAKGETVHHLNGDTRDNRPENLELWVRNHPAGQRAADLNRSPAELQDLDNCAM